MENDTDIVARLRNCLCIPDCLCGKAADEIERLRAGGCSRDQTTTQFCAEAVALQREVERLRRDYSCICNEMRRMKEERDAARREVCRIDADTYGSVGLVAERRGWDCFKEEADHNNNHFRTHHK